MEARPEIDMDRYHDLMADNVPVIQESGPKDPPARFCGSECRSNYREERMSGVQLPRHSMNGQDVSHKQMCAQLKICAYCESRLE